MTDYINPIPSVAESRNPMEVSENAQKTPKRTTVKYQTTAIFEDIGEEKEENTGKVSTR